MVNQNFSLSHIKTLSQIDAIKYIDSYFIPLTNGDHAFLHNGIYEIIDDAVVRKTYFKRMSREINDYYFTKKTDLKTIIYEINKPQLYDDFLNMCPQMKHKYVKYETFSQDIKDKVKIMLKHIKKVICSSKNDMTEYFIKWLANMVQGIRNKTALYLKGPQGCGKSTITEFIKAHVIGDRLCFQGGSNPLKNKFNSELSGKIMVVYEELENFGPSEWISISSTLKRMITSPTLNIELKGKEIVTEKNLNNTIIISNNDAIQDDDGRRFVICDISLKYIGNEEYFDKIYSYYNDEVGHAFYCYLMEVDIKDFKPQSYPITTSKLDSYSKRLDSVYKFVKDNYVLNKIELSRTTVNDLYEEYKIYCGPNHAKPKNKIDFNISLKNVGINHYKSNGHNVYKQTVDELLEIANKHHWIHELDEMVEVKPKK